MTVGEFLKVCNRIKFMLQDKETEIGCINREGLEKYFFDHKVKEISYHKHEDRFLITIADE